jgi:hypothetical protein
MAVYSADEQIKFCLHILHLRAPLPLFFSTLGDEQLLKQYPITSDKTMAGVWIYTEVNQFQELLPVEELQLAQLPL